MILLDERSTMLQNGPATLQIGRGLTWEWSDLRYFLSVARSGTTLGAARLLGVKQTTCARRIEALERVLGLALFECTSTG